MITAMAARLLSVTAADACFSSHDVTVTKTDELHRHLQVRVATHLVSEPHVTFLAHSALGCLWNVRMVLLVCS